MAIIPYLPHSPKSEVGIVPWPCRAPSLAVEQIVGHFHTRYEQGEVGDDVDFVQWAATVEMCCLTNKGMEGRGAKEKARGAELF